MQKKKDDKKNRDPKTVEMIEQVKKQYAKDKSFSKSVVEKMQELRAYLITLEQPTLVKSVRLVYEYAEAFDGFEIDVWEEEGGLSSLDYFFYLLANAHNRYNREEIKALNVFLKARLAGEEAVFIRPDEEDDDDEKA